MRRRTLFWKLFPVYLLICLLSVALVSAYALQALQEFSFSQTEDDLLIRTQLVSRQISPNDLMPGNRAALSELTDALASSSGTRVTVIAPDGQVIADSHHNPGKMENHADRPEFRQAVTKGVGMARRRSPTLGVMMVYAALPIQKGGMTIGVLRTALAASKVEAGPALAVHRVAIGAFAIALLAAAASLIAARRISDPLARMKEASERFAGGDFRARIPIPDTEEMASLAEALNQTAAQIDCQLRTITQQAREREAILAGMKEGVIAVGKDDRILTLNPAAESLLGVRLESARDRTVQETIRNPNLQRFITESYEAEGAMVEEIAVHVPEERLLQATGTPLVDADGKVIGALVVLNDITQTRKLENMRKEFVANVSHELKTPITSIKGFLETLHGGTVKDPKKAREFMETAIRQTDRLNAIIDDLLTLSRIEQKAESEGVDLEKHPICPILLAAVLNCQAKASEAGVVVAVDCRQDLTALANAPLLEQAITNLLDNAIKYSPRKGQVQAVAREADGELVISVSDKGPGIDPEDIPRLFERFYRIDGARSRKLGGTGLGLAITKHIVQAHRGRIEVHSVPGEGSTFSIHLPLRIDE